jgi:adenosylhomocysteine nucleosidase
MKLGIIGAVKQEVELMFSELALSPDAVRIAERARLNFHEGTLNGCPAVVVCCGVGKVNAALCAQILISEFGVDAIINTGSAGGLAENLEVLDMVVSTETVQHDFDTTPFGYKMGQIPGMDSPFFASDEALRKIALSAFTRVSGVGKMVEGRIATGDSFITDTDKRELIVGAFNPACVEMEGAAVAQVCAANAIPHVILRSVSDLAGKEATMSYDDFSRKASHVSARVVMEMASECAAAIAGKRSMK